MAGCSWSTEAIRAAFGRLISPPSGVSSPRISLNRVDLPTPLRPTSPTLAPDGSETVAESKKRRPQPLNTRLSIWSMSRSTEGGG